MQQIKQYKNQSEANHDMHKMGKNGWQVQTQSVGSYRKASFVGWVMFGIFNLMRKNKARQITVVYSK